VRLTRTRAVDPNTQFFKTKKYATSSLLGVAYFLVLKKKKRSTEHPLRGVFFLKKWQP
jgi:hypothetical protein